ncbi:MAG: lipopolysaccharide core heptose(I) kinase RfaP [Halioglobus sp.]
MAEHFLREDIAVGVPAGVDTASGLLEWARRVAASASEKNVYRTKEGRKTLRFELQGRSYFLKLHSGIGWVEIFKNLLQGRLPVVGAANEYRAVAALRSLGVDTLAVAAFARTGHNPADQQSMIVTDDLVGTVSLEDYCAQWSTVPPDPGIRRRLILKLADSARRMHGAGINHRDFYICHFHLDENSLAEQSLRCYLIDLHRAQIRRHLPRRWQVKDLAGLYFSAMDCGLTRRDLLRFMHYYSPGGLRQALGGNAGLWRQVERRALQLYGKGHGRQPPGLPPSGQQSGV